MDKRFLKRFLSIVVMAVLLCSVFGQTLAFAQEQEANEGSGWTEIPFSEDTREIFVSSSEGNDANDGLSAETPVKTIEKGMLLLRNGYPDHLLLKRGDVWTDPHFGHPDVGGFTFPRFLNGRSAEEPIVISYYGDAGDRPLLKIKEFFIHTNGQARNYVWIIGLEVRGYKFDPSDPAYDPTAYGAAAPDNTGSQPKFIMHGGAGWLVEDCKFEFLSIDVMSVGAKVSDFRMRRCIVAGAWVPNSSTSREPTRPSGIYASGTEGLLIEECTFDHNGWNEEAEGLNAGRNMFNHNLYLQSDNNGSKVVVRGNIVTRGAANGVQQRSGGLMEDNLFAGNSIGILIADDLAGGHTSTFGICRNNVVSEGQAQYPYLNLNVIQSSAVAGITINSNHSMPMEISGNIVSNRTDSSTNEGIQKRINEFVTYTENYQYNWNAETSTFFGDTEDPGWLDPDRTVARYNAEVLGGDESLDDFADAARNRGLREWPKELTSYAVNEWIREGFTVPLEEPLPAFKVSTDANLIKKGDYFNVSAGFESVVSSNTALLTYLYNPALFEYRAFTPAEGNSTVKVDNDAVNGVLKVILMNRDYNTTDFGRAMFSAREDADITNVEHSIDVSAEFVHKNEEGEKNIYKVSGSTNFSSIGKPGDTTGDGKVDLIDLSNIIDWFGADNTHPEWSKFKFYDYNNNGVIDIPDIAWLASLIEV